MIRPLGREIYAVSRPLLTAYRISLSIKRSVLGPSNALVTAPCRIRYAHARTVPGRLDLR